LRKLFNILFIHFIPCCIYAQGAYLIVGKGAYYSGGTNSYTVTAGDIKNDGNIATSSSNLRAIGTTQQFITCFTLSGGYCPNIFNTSVYNTVLGNVDQQNSAGLAIETNTLVMGTHLFTQGSTEIREGNYFLYNSVAPFNSNDATSKFFVTTGAYHGLLKQRNVGSSILYPLGTAANANNYTPATITYGGSPDSFGLRVFDNVYYDYYHNTNGDPVAGSSITNIGFVGKTWIVNKGTPVAGNFSTEGFTAMLQWNAVNENAFFTPSRPYNISVVRNHDVLWIPVPPEGPSTNPFGPGPYTRTDFVSYDNAFYSYYPISVSAINHVLAAVRLNLKGELSGANVKLEWTTLSEINTMHFNIEKSNDGVHYIKIGELSASGNTTNVHHYSFVDSNVNVENNYYRVSLIDKDGKSTLSNIILIKLDHVSKGIILLSNPAFNNIRILFKNKVGNYTADVYTSLGNKVKTETIKVVGVSETYSIQTQNWTSGVYYIKLMNHVTKEVTTVPVIVLQ
jgi:hypothetical protein